MTARKVVPIVNWRNYSDNYQSQSLFVPQVILHDLCSPLSSLAGVFNMLDWDKVDGTNRELLIAGEQALAQALRMINNAPADVQDYELVSINVGKALKQIVQAFRGLVTESEIKLNFISAGDYLISGDPIIFERVIVNVLMNAMQALRQISKQRFLDVIVVKDGVFVQVIIKDNGMGIDRRKVAEILSRSVNLRNPGGKTTGLQFVKAAMQEYFYGKLEIISSLHNGTEVRLSFIL